MKLCARVHNNVSQSWTARLKLFLRSFASVSPSHPLHGLFARLDPTTHSDVRVDAQSASLYPNHISRPVVSGHLVYVEPTPLPDPEIVGWTADLAKELGLEELACYSEAFLKLFSGDIDGAGAKDVLKPWATPYAVSVFGRPALNPDQFGGGYGYGDGRALSLGVFQGNSHPWELQLKGAGRTPFSRTFDGRAVLRSSIREFLVSEAMHHLGVPTTRALSLTMSDSEYVSRAWYKTDEAHKLSEEEDDHEATSTTLTEMEEDKGQCTRFSEHEEDIREQPDVMVRERCAILCRAAPSFLRVGHVELYGRRAWRDPKGKEELGMLIQHAIRREFPSIELYNSCKDSPSSPSFCTSSDHSSTQQQQPQQQQQQLQQQQQQSSRPATPTTTHLLQMLTQFAERQATLVTHWMRVGYVQGNMNSDNCLLSGRTMDYGPFGFMEAYSPLWTPFTSDAARNYGFENQPSAANTNLLTLAQNLIALMPEGAKDLENEFVSIVYQKFPEMLAEQMYIMHKAKLGLPQADQKLISELWEPLSELLRGVDFTIFWRQLSVYSNSSGHSFDKDNILQPLQSAIYPEYVSVNQQKLLAEWVRRYVEVAAAAGDNATRYALMRKTSPKYVPREWMLTHAYQAAEKGDLRPLNELKGLFQFPYDEHPSLETKYYRLTPKHLRGKGGISFYS